MGKTTTGESLPLDVRKMHRSGCLARGYVGVWRWWRGSDPSRGSSIGFQSDGQGVTLQFTARGEEVKQRLLLDFTPCNFGGRRVWWKCPVCSRRVAVLYSRGRFACRHCLGLGYACQLEQPMDRGLRRVWKLRAKLGDNGNVGDFVRCPKGMHGPTFARLMRQLKEAERADLEALCARFSGFPE